MGSQAKKKNNQRVTYNISLDDLEVKKSMPPGVCQPQCARIISEGAFISTPYNISLAAEEVWFQVFVILSQIGSVTAMQKERYQSQINQNFGTICHSEICLTFSRLKPEFLETDKKIMSKTQNSNSNIF